MFLEWTWMQWPNKNSLRCHIKIACEQCSFTEHSICILSELNRKPAELWMISISVAKHFNVMTLSDCKWSVSLDWRRNPKHFFPGHSILLLLLRRNTAGRRNCCHCWLCCCSSRLLFVLLFIVCYENLSRTTVLFCFYAVDFFYRILILMEMTKDRLSEMVNIRWGKNDELTVKYSFARRLHIIFQALEGASVEHCMENHTNSTAHDAFPLDFLQTHQTGTTPTNQPKNQRAPQWAAARLLHAFSQVLLLIYSHAITTHSQFTSINQHTDDLDRCKRSKNASPHSSLERHQMNVCNVFVHAAAICWLPSAVV